MKKIFKRILGGTVTALCALTLASSIGTRSLPNEYTLVARRAVGQHLDLYTKFKGFTSFSNPEVNATLDHLVEEAREGMQTLYPFPDEPNRAPPVTVLKVTGTPEEQGYVYGTLLRDQIRDNVNIMMDFVYAHTWPGQLEEVWKQREPFIPESYVKELRAIAKASGVKFETLKHLHTVAEIAEETCSGLALSSDNTADGASYHMRILDFATYLGVQKNPVVVVHDTRDRQGNKVGNTYTNVAWAGFHWSVGGINEKGLAIGEIGAGSSDHVEIERPDGIPMGVLIREALLKSNSVYEAEHVFADAHRNLRYVYVLSDTNSQLKILTGPTVFLTTDPGEDLPSLGEGYDSLPGFPGMIWHGAQHEKQIELFQEKHTGFTLQDIMEHAKQVGLPKKSLHTWIFKRDTNELWVANGIGTKIRSVDLPYVHIDLDDYFGR